MAKGAYIGVDGVARKIKKGYIGVQSCVVQRTGGRSIYDGNSSGYGYFASSYTIDDSTLNFTINCNIRATLATAVANGYFCPENNGYLLTAASTYTGATIVVAEADMSVSNRLGVGILTASLQNVARRIKKAYIGIGGVARPCWSGGEVAYYGKVTPLARGRYHLRAASIGDYALFSDGPDWDSTTYNIMEAYNKSLTKTSAPNMSNRFSTGAATPVGNYALFGGSTYYMNGIFVDAYSSTLTRTSAPNFDMNIHNQAATSVGDFALFGGGEATDPDGNGVTGNVYAYNSSLTQTIKKGALTMGGDNAATTIKNHAIFAGGNYIENTSVIAFDLSLTRTQVAPKLNQSRYNLAAASNGKYALFGGGTWAGYPKDIVDVFDESLTYLNPVSLRVARDKLSATQLGDYAIFGGGDMGDNLSPIVDAFDQSLTRIALTNLSELKSWLAATTVGDFALFGGGFTNDHGGTTTVDAYTLV